MFVRTESFRSFIRFYPIVTILVGINILMWLYINIAPNGISVYKQLIGFNLAVEQGEWWRLFTPIFLHQGFGHMLFNSFSLVLFGPALERLLGKGKILFVYVISGIIANIATFIFAPSFYLHLGASGAIFGLFGVYLYILVFRKELIDRANQQIILTIMVIGLIMTFLQPNINITAHLFGLLAGTVVAPLVLKTTRIRFL